MKHIITALAGFGVPVAANASEEQVAEAVKTALSNNPDKARADKLATELEEFKTAQITALKENAIASGRCTAENWAHYEAFAKADFKGCSAALNAIPVRTKITANLNTGAGGRSNEESRKDWDFEKWSQEDPEGLKTLKASQPEQYTAMLNKFIS